MVRGSHLLAQFVLDVFFDTAQHERLEDHMQSTKLVLVEFIALILCSILDVLREPFVELVMGIEQTRHDEMQQCPEFYTRGTSEVQKLTRTELSTYLACCSELGFRSTTAGSGSGIQATSSNGHWTRS